MVFVTLALASVAASKSGRPAASCAAMADAKVQPVPCSGPSLPMPGDKGKEGPLHGTGCTFASAIAAQLAAGRPLFEAATLAKAYVTKAIEKGYPIGKGRVPLDHFYRLRIEPLARGTHEVPQHGMHPAAEPAH